MPTAEERAGRIARVRQFPALLEATIAPLSEEQLDAVPPGEWTVRQNVHHLADAHMNAFVRCKLAVCQEQPIITPWEPDAWASTVEARALPVEYSLAILRGLHARWVALFESLDDVGYARVVMHPERGLVNVDSILETYAGHGEAHLKQISEALVVTGAMR
jgi:hypothetical protein